MKKYTRFRMNKIESILRPCLCFEFHAKHISNYSSEEFAKTVGKNTTYLIKSFLSAGSNHSTVTSGSVILLNMFATS